jgi:hypothetical protein
MSDPVFKHNRKLHASQLATLAEIRDCIERVEFGTEHEWLPGVVMDGYERVLALAATLLDGWHPVEVS